MDNNKNTKEFNEFGHIMDRMLDCKLLTQITAGEIKRYKTLKETMDRASAVCDEREFDLLYKVCNNFEKTISEIFHGYGVVEKIESIFHITTEGEMDDEQHDAIVKDELLIHLINEYDVVEHIEINDIKLGNDVPLTEHNIELDLISKVVGSIQEKEKEFYIPESEVSDLSENDIVQ